MDYASSVSLPCFSIRFAPCAHVFTTTRRKSQPVTWNDGQPRHSWFDIENLPPTVCEFDEPGISESTEIIENIILSKVHGGSDTTKIVLAGFSQGAAQAMMVALTTLHDLGGVASLSGWIPRRMRNVSRYCPHFCVDVNYIAECDGSQQMIHTEPNLPIFWGHGTADEEIPLDYAKESVEFLKGSLGIPERAVRFVEYDGLEHQTNYAEIEDFGRWLSEILSEPAENT